jgi:acyl-CoA thioesterase-1
MGRRQLLIVAALAGLSACSLQNVSCQAPAVEPVEDLPVDIATPVDPLAPTTMKIVALGDSLTAGLGLLSEEAYPAQLELMLQDDGFWEVEVINAGVSGDTTAGGLRRVDAVIADQSVRILIVALGGNDALRGFTTDQTQANLRAIIDRATGEGVDVLLAGMLAPTNLGTDYQTAFRALYQELAIEYNKSILFVPFLLEGVAGNPALNQPDGIHPTAEGQRMIAEVLYPRRRSASTAAVPWRSPGRQEAASPRFSA